MAEREEGSAAASAAERVRAIVEAAEQAASALEADAREEAERIRVDAERDAAAARQAVEHLGERADALERRLDELFGAVRDAVAELRGALDGLRSAGPAGAEPGAAPVVDEATIAEAEAVAAREPDVSGEGAAVAGEEEPAAVAGEEAPPAAPEGARVLALKMALDGAPREDTARYLRENFELSDPDSLLDEVYAKAGR
jgi:hypothetical protein